MDAASIAALARPVLAALFTVLAAAGVLHGTDSAMLDATATLVGALGALGMALWGYLHSKTVVPVAQAQLAAQHAFSAASQPTIAPTAPYSDAAIAGAQAAVARAKAIGP